MDLGQVVVYITSNIRGLVAGLGTAQRQVGNFVSSIPGMWYTAGNSVARAVDKTTAHISRSTRIQGFVITSLGLTITRLYRDVINQGADFERKFNNIVQAMGEKQIELNFNPEQIEAEARKLQNILEDTAGEYGRDLSEMYDLLVEGLQNGLEATEDHVRAFTKYAAQIQILDPAGTAVLADAGEILTRILNIYPQLAEQFDSYDDFLYYIRNEVVATVNQAQSSIGEYSENIAELQGLTRALFDDQKLAFEEANSAFAALSRLTTPGESTTMIRALLTNVLKQTDQTVKLAKELGLEYDAHTLKQKGLLQFSKDIVQTIQKSLLPGTKEYDNLMATLVKRAKENVKVSKDWAAEIEKIRDQGQILLRKRASLEAKLREIQGQQVKTAEEARKKGRQIYDVQTQLLSVNGQIEDKVNDLTSATEAYNAAVASGGAEYNATGKAALELIDKIERGVVTSAEVISQLTGRKEATQGLIYLGEVNEAISKITGKATTLAEYLQETREGLRKLVDDNLTRKLGETSILLGQIATEGLILILTWFRQNQGQINEFLVKVVELLRRGTELLKGAEPNGKLEKFFLWITSPEVAKFVGLLGVALLILGPALILISAISDIIGFLVLTLHGLWTVLGWILFGPWKILAWIGGALTWLMTLIFGAPASGSWLLEFLSWLYRSAPKFKEATKAVGNAVKGVADGFFRDPKKLISQAKNALGRLFYAVIIESMLWVDKLFLALVLYFNTSIVRFSVWLENLLLTKFGKVGAFLVRTVVATFDKAWVAIVRFAQGGLTRSLAGLARYGLLLLRGLVVNFFRMLWVSAIWPALTALWGLLVTAIVGLAATLGLPVWAVVAIIVAVVAAIVAIVYFFWDEISAVVTSIWEFIKPYVDAVAELWLALAELIWVWIQIIWEGIKWVALTIWDIVLLVVGAIVGAVLWLWDKVTTFFLWLWEKLTELGSAIWAFITTIWGRVIEFFAWIWDSFGFLLDWLWGKIKGFLDWVLSFFGTSVDEILLELKSAWDWVVTNVWDPIISRLEFLWGWVVGKFNTVKEIILSGLKIIRDSVIGIINDLTRLVKMATGSSREILDAMREENSTKGRGFASGRIVPRGGMNANGGGRFGDSIPARLMPGESVLTKAETNKLAAISGLLSGSVLRDLMGVTAALAAGARYGALGGTSKGGETIQNITQNNVVNTEVDMDKVVAQLARRARRREP